MVTIQREFEECDVALRVHLWEKVKFSLNFQVIRFVASFCCLQFNHFVNSHHLFCCIVVSHVYTVQCILI